MSSCYSLNLELTKTFSPSNSSSPSESRNSPRSILTRKARTPRKRPNQTYKEAAAILSTAYPKIFPLKKPLKFTKSLENRSPPFLSHPHDHGYLLPVLQVRRTESRGLNSLKACDVESRVYKYAEMCDDDFSAKSLLDEEIEEGIDSIMGMNENDVVYSNCGEINTCPVGLELRAMRHVDEGDWWRFPCVDVAEIMQQIPVKGEKESSAILQPSTGLCLKLDYDDVLKAWSGKGSCFAESAGNDVQVRLAQTDLFPELLYKEKRCTRVFSKKPRYHITKLKADQRPRLKGRFMKTANPIM